MRPTPAIAPAAAFRVEIAKVASKMQPRGSRGVWGYVTQYDDRRTDDPGFATEALQNGGTGVMRRKHADAQTRIAGP
jgi:hypothetical protein